MQIFEIYRAASAGIPRSLLCVQFYDGNIFETNIAANSSGTAMVSKLIDGIRWSVTFTKLESGFYLASVHTDAANPAIYHFRSASTSMWGMGGAWSKVEGELDMPVFGGGITSVYWGD